MRIIQAVASENFAANTGEEKRQCEILQGESSLQEHDEAASESIHRKDEGYFSETVFQAVDRLSRRDDQ